jgi:hypothetical protein
VSRGLVNKSVDIPNSTHNQNYSELYTYAGGAFWKVNSKNYYKTVEKGVADVVVKRKQLRKDMDMLLLELIKKTHKDEYSMLNASVSQ